MNTAIAILLKLKLSVIEVSPLAAASNASTSNPRWQVPPSPPLPNSGRPGPPLPTGRCRWRIRCPAEGGYRTGRGWRTSRQPSHEGSHRHPLRIQVCTGPGTVGTLGLVLMEHSHLKIYSRWCSWKPAWSTGFSTEDSRPIVKVGQTHWK